MSEHRERKDSSSSKHKLTASASNDNYDESSSSGKKKGSQVASYISLPQIPSTAVTPAAQTTVGTSSPSPPTSGGSSSPSTGLAAPRSGGGRSPHGSLRRTENEYGFREIDPGDLIFEEKIGKGAFGIVYKVPPLLNRMFG